MIKTDTVLSARFMRPKASWGAQATVRWWMKASVPTAWVSSIVFTTLLMITPSLGSLHVSFTVMIARPVKAIPITACAGNKPRSMAEQCVTAQSYTRKGQGERTRR
jgi:hypothetical protein